VSSDLYRTVTDHLEELRWSLTKSLAAVLLAFGLSYPFSDRFFAWMVEPLKAIVQGGPGLIGTGVAEAFFIEIKLAMVVGALLASPFIFYQIWRLIAPRVHSREKRFVIPFVLCTTLFFAAGAYFCYRVVLPLTFLYFIDQYRSLAVSPEIRIGEYFTFFFRIVLAFGIAFELPVFTFFLVRLGLWNHRLLWRQFRYALLVIFILAAILTPGPDVVSQVLLAIPLTLLYLLSIGVAYIWRRKET
jgi:sec-independent protein translocase protein TatC